MYPEGIAISRFKKMGGSLGENVLQPTNGFNKTNGTKTSLVQQPWWIK